MPVSTVHLQPTASASHMIRGVEDTSEEPEGEDPSPPRASPCTPTSSRIQGSTEPRADTCGRRSTRGVCRPRSSPRTQCAWPASKTDAVAGLVEVRQLTLVLEAVDEILRGRVCSGLASRNTCETGQNSSCPNCSTSFRYRNSELLRDISDVRRTSWRR